MLLYCKNTNVVADSRTNSFHVRTNHVHVVITANAKPEKVLNDLKVWCSRRLRESLSEPGDRERWTRHGSTRYIWKEYSLAEAIRYVLDEQGERMAYFRAESISTDPPQSRKR